jgi:hypothetical protein
MTRTGRQLTALVILSGCLASEAHARGSQANRLQRERDEILARQAQQQLQQNPAELDATRTRQALDKVLKTYPPSVRQILQLDPTLISNPSYLAPYPKLADFLRDHPSIARNPNFFIGVPKQATSRRAPSPVVVYQDLDAIAFSVFALGVIGGIAWLVHATIRHQKWLRLSKGHADAQAKILERFSSNEDLLNFIQTPAGRHFLESSSMPEQPKAVSAPISQILWSVQIGLVLFSGGLGLNFINAGVVGDLTSGIISMVGTLVIALGAGFILSGFSSYILSKKFGLLNSTDATSQTPPS